MHHRRRQPQIIISVVAVIIIEQILVIVVIRRVAVIDQGTLAGRLCDVHLQRGGGWRQWASGARVRIQEILR